MGQEEEIIREPSEELEDIEKSKIEEKRCSSKRVLLVSIILVIVLLVCIVIAVTLAVLLSNRRICGTEGCVENLVETLDHIDESVRPCDDFYGFACGNFADSTGHSSLKKSTERAIADELNKIVTESMLSTDPVSLTMQKDFYRSCLEDQSSDQDKDTTAKNLFSMLGGWPIVEGHNWKRNNLDWTEVLKKCVEFGLNFEWFLTLNVIEDPDDNMRYLYIGYPIDVFPVDEDKKTRDYNLLTDIVGIMGAPRESIPYEIQRIKEFQTELENICQNASEREQYGIDKAEKMRIIYLESDDQGAYGISWLELLRAITGQEMTYEDIVVVRSVRYLKNLNELLLKTPSRFVLDYIIWKLNLWPYMSKFFRERVNQYSNDFDVINRNTFCLVEAQNRFPGVADAIYIRDKVLGDPKDEIKELITNIKYKFVTRLNKITWMDNDTLRDALVNITRLLDYVGGPDEIFDEMRYEEILGYRGFGYDITNVIEKLCETNRQRTRAMFRDMKIPSRGYHIPQQILLEWTSFQDENYESRVVPAILLRPEFYDPYRPKYAKYGLLGTFLSYKISHTINRMILRDIESRKKKQWWSNNIEDTDKTDCLAENPEDEYTITNSDSKIRIDSSFTDNVAIDVVYEVYQQWLKNNGPEEEQIKHKYTPNQLFWISSMQGFCSAQTSETGGFELGLKEHLLGNKLIRNSMYFPNVFSCPLGAEMNPYRKCQVM